MSYIIETPWVLIVIFGSLLIGCTVVFCCWLEKAINEVLNIGNGCQYDEHEDNSAG